MLRYWGHSLGRVNAPLLASFSGKVTFRYWSLSPGGNIAKRGHVTYRDDGRCSALKCSVEILRFFCIRYVKRRCR